MHSSQDEFALAMDIDCLHFTAMEEQKAFTAMYERETPLLGTMLEELDMAGFDPTKEPEGMSGRSPRGVETILLSVVARASINKRSR